MRCQNLRCKQISSVRNTDTPPGGQFNLVTKTGTNAWHGTGEWYTQNRNFNSIDNLTKQAIEAGTILGQPAYHNNPYGGTTGGPPVQEQGVILRRSQRTLLPGQSPAN